jgi:hypothetical protein
MGFPVISRKGRLSPLKTANLPPEFQALHDLLESGGKLCARRGGELLEERRALVAKASEADKGPSREVRHWLESAVPVETGVPAPRQEAAQEDRRELSVLREGIEQSRRESLVYESHHRCVHDCLDILANLQAHPKNLDFLASLRAEAEEYARDFVNALQEGRGLEAHPEYVLTVLLQYRQILQG